MHARLTTAHARPAQFTIQMHRIFLKSHSGPIDISLIRGPEEGDTGAPEVISQSANLLSPVDHASVPKVPSHGQCMAVTRLSHSRHMAVLHGQRMAVTVSSPT